MSERNLRVRHIHGLLNEYLQASSLISVNERSTDRLLAKIKDLDAHNSELAKRQAEITAELAPLFKGGGHVGAYRRGEKFAVNHDEGDAYLTVRPLRPVSSLIDDAEKTRMFSDAAFGEDDEAEIISLPGRLATVGRSVTVIDQEVG